MLRDWCGRLRSGVTEGGAAGRTELRAGLVEATTADTGMRRANLRHTCAALAAEGQVSGDRCVAGRATSRPARFGYRPLRLRQRHEVPGFFCLGTGWKSLAKECRNGQRERQRIAWRKFRCPCTLHAMHRSVTCLRSLPAMALLALGCAGGSPPQNAAPVSAPAPAAAGVTSSLLPAIPPVTGPIRIRVMYPAQTDQVDVRDSTFLFGTVGTGDAQLW